MFLHMSEASCVLLQRLCIDCRMHATISSPRPTAKSRAGISIAQIARFSGSFQGGQQIADVFHEVGEDHFRFFDIGMPALFPLERQPAIVAIAL